MDAMRKALDRIVKQLNESPEKTNPKIYYEPEPEGVEFAGYDPYQQFGMGIPPNPQRGFGQQRGYGDSRAFSAPGGPGGGRGEQWGQQPQIPNNAGMMYGGQQQGGGGGGQQQGGGGGGQQGTAGGGFQDVVVPYPVSEHLIGGVIGRSGANISDIRRRSGATVKIDNKDANSTERMITITGTGQSVAVAISMIQAHLQNQ